MHDDDITWTYAWRLGEASATIRILLGQFGPVVEADRVNARALLEREEHMQCMEQLFMGGGANHVGEDTDSESRPGPSGG